MDKKSRIVVFALIILTIISIFMLYRRSYITKDFEIVNEDTTNTSN